MKSYRCRQLQTYINSKCRDTDALCAATTFIDNNKVMHKKYEYIIYMHI